MAEYTAWRVKKVFYAKGLLTPDRADDIDSSAYHALVNIALYDLQHRQDELTDAFFRKGFKLFKKRYIIQVFKTMANKKRKNISITKPNGQDFEFHDKRLDWLEGDVIDYTGCPHAEYARRIFVHKEHVNEVFPDPKDRKHWYNVMLPEIKTYMRKLYDMGE